MYPEHDAGMKSQCPLNWMAKEDIYGQPHFFRSEKKRPPTPHFAGLEVVLHYIDLIFVYPNKVEQVHPCTGN